MSAPPLTIPMPLSPETKARLKIDDLLQKAGWVVQDRLDADPTAARGVAIREFPMKSGFGEADYLLYVDGAVVGVVEAKKEGSTLSGFETQIEKYSKGLPEGIPVPRTPLPFLYLSTGIETQFVNLLEPDASSRRVFAFHRPETLVQSLDDEVKQPGSTVKAKLRRMPTLEEANLRPAQFTAIQNLERSWISSTMVLPGMALTHSSFWRCPSQCRRSSNSGASAQKSNALWVGPLDR